MDTQPIQFDEEMDLRIFPKEKFDLLKQLESESHDFTKSIYFLT